MARILTEEQREKLRESNRKYRCENAEKVRESRRKYRLKMREMGRKRNNWLAEKRNCPEKRLARMALTRAVHRNKIVKPDLCSKCGIVCKPEGHHEDYSKPLDVVWVCQPCHQEIHRGRAQRHI